MNMTIKQVKLKEDVYNKEHVVDAHASKDDYFDPHGIVKTCLFKELEQISWSLIHLIRPHANLMDDIHSNYDDIHEEKLEANEQTVVRNEDLSDFLMTIILHTRLFQELMHLPVQNNIMINSSFNALENVSWPFIHLNTKEDSFVMDDIKKDLAEVRPFITKEYPRKEELCTADLFSEQWPIHALCAMDAPLHMLKILLEIFPSHLETSDNQDKLPLHIACERGASIEWIQELVEANPQTVFAKDPMGRIPLDFIQRSDCGHKTQIMETLISIMESNCDAGFSVVKDIPVAHQCICDNYSFVPLRCTKCQTLLLMFQLSSIPMDNEVISNERTDESNVFFCITCRKDVVTYNGKLEDMLERSLGPLYLVWNPYDGVVSSIPLIREKIIECYKLLMYQETRTGIEKLFNIAKVTMGVYEGGDVHLMGNLFAAVHKVLVYLNLLKVYTDDNPPVCSRINTDPMKTILEIHSITKRITLRLKKLVDEMNTAKKNCDIVAENTTLLNRHFNACRIMKNRLLGLVEQKPDNMYLKHEFEKAANAMKVAEAQITMLHLEYQDHVTVYKAREREIREVSHWMKIHLQKMKMDMVQATIHTKTTPMMCCIQNVTKLVHDHVSLRTDAVFSSFKIMKEETDFLLNLSKRIVYIYRDCISDSMSDMNDYRKEMREIQSLGKEMVMSGYLTWKLPILCSVDKSLNELLAFDNQFVVRP